MIKPMATLFLDLSANCVRALVAEEGRVVDVHNLGALPQGGDKLKAILTQLFAACGYEIDRAHLILQESDVVVEECKLQKMLLADAEKILLRQEAAQGGQERTPRLTKLAGPEHQLLCLTESVGKAVIADYRKVFLDAGIRLETITSSLQAILAAFGAVRQDMQHVEVVFTISSGSVTALFLSRDELFRFERIDLPVTEYDSTDAADPVRAMKRQQFAVLTPLHSFYSHFMLENPDLRVDKIWLCGPFPGIEAVAVSLAEATELDVVLADQIADIPEGDCSFTALAGVLRVGNDPDRFNFIPAEMLKPGKARLQRFLVLALSVFLLLVIVMVFITEKRISDLRGELKQAGQELESISASMAGTKSLADSLSFLSALEKQAPPFYKLLRELAETLPDSLDLQSLRYQLNEANATLELVAVAEYGALGGGADVFTAMTGVLDSSSYLSSYDDPVIEVLLDGDTKLIQISIACTLSPAGGSDR